MTLLGLSGFGFSLEAFAAGALALWIALGLNLDRPYRALVTVYVLIQPLSGAVRSKGFDRPGGTLAAAAVTLGLVAGITIAVIGVPSVAAPIAVFTTAVARTEEIAIGVFCATLVDAVSFPHSAGSVLNAQTQSWLAEAERRIGDVLGQSAPHPDTGQGFGTFAAEAAQMISLSTQAHYDTAARPPHPRIVRLLHKRMLTLLPLLSSARDLLVGPRQGGDEASGGRRRSR